MKKWILFSALSLTGLMSACNDDDSLNPVFISDSAFETAADGWVAQFSEYSTETDSTTFEMSASRTRLPFGLDTSKYAYRMQSHNRADDMFMYLKKKVTGFDPNKIYNVTFEVTLGTNYPENSVGIGGSPGSSVYLKAGASSVQPTRQIKDKMYEFNLDKGAQSQEGADAIILGNVSNGDDKTVYKLAQKNSGSKTIAVKPNEAGEIWLFVGTDSGFEGLTILYYDRIKVFLTAQ
ncbi:hypothetical protein [Dyadobacter fanqingshengii]|uniref:Lipoprotein n=1 Tax=Dyadobacter fanqingshengii TaxID=2906443 RepID=A0A9X1P7N2_9BACT|nr:hypothetical protein [Dyadobacter fanqingshengii]MCF0039550.1 hypothetical protein [Dyadobacter fanqingshengii]USJ33643.1 hypothetical protein NFI81_13070 [Dyadobacter fanqingshengii]